MTKKLDHDVFKLVETENVTIYGYLDPHDLKLLWLIVEDIPNWSLSTYKEWMYFIYHLREAAYEKGITHLLVATDFHMAKFAEMLAFEKMGTTKDHIVMGLETNVHRS